MTEIDVRVVIQMNIVPNTLDGTTSWKKQMMVGLGSRQHSLISRHEGLGANDEPESNMAGTSCY